MPQLSSSVFGVIAAAPCDTGSATVMYLSVLTISVLDKVQRSSSLTIRSEGAVDGFAALLEQTCLHVSKMSWSYLSSQSILTHSDFDQSRFISRLWFHR